MPLNPIEAVQLTLVVVSLVFAGACYLGWRLFDKPRHALLWTCAFLLAALQYGLNLLRDQIPVYEVWWIAVNGVSCLLVIAAAAGHRVRLAQPAPLWLAACLFAGLSLAQLVFTVFVPRIDIRVALAPGFACVAFLHVAWILLRHGPQPRLAQRVAAGVHLLFGLAQGLAAGIALQFGLEPSQAQRDAYNLVNFALMPNFFVAMGITAIFLLGTDLATRLRQLAVTDSLTGLANRRGFMQAAARLLAQALRRRQPLTLVIADLDFFKKINDGFGHNVGDRALSHFAGTLARGLRGEDVAGRIGGEEFAVLLLGDVDDAQQVVARLRDMLAEQPMHVGAEVVPVRASFGIAQWLGEQEVESLLIRADRALYQAKDAGRDTVMLAPGEPASNAMSPA
ncbi:MAG: GGDEF domain-containing protein [Chromatocurvus sp.]